MAQVKDPVCGMMIDDSRAAATSDHEGERYYFCSQECKTKFDDNPKRYTGRA
ncbi:MAG TPA: YHS domain-containing protein [Gemmatimonadales bacterium]|jgi:Cu+-exporting ATPase|nr:YHS domain-containing protein [Gemmatimonadales bacterium]